MSAIWIPPQLASPVDEDDCRARREWLTALPELIAEIASDWALELGDPYLPGGQRAWVAPPRDPGGKQVVLKVSWRRRKAEHEAQALAHWNGQGAICCRRAQRGQHERAAAGAMRAGHPAPMLNAGTRPGRRGCGSAPPLVGTPARRRSPIRFAQGDVR
jgi:hypothetical protein